MHFSTVVIAGSMKPCIVIVLDTLQAHTMTHKPCPIFYAPLTLSKFTSSLEIEVHFPAAVIAGSMKPCIVIVLDILSSSTHHDQVPLTYISSSTDFVKILRRV